jgi:hypothetical protein
MKLQFNEAVIAKLTVKKVLHQIDHVEMLIAMGDPCHDIKLTLSDWFTEMRVHLRRIEYMTEQSVH